MNMISLLRERIVRDGETTISAFEFDLLQEEWIRRSKDEDRFDRLRAELEQVERALSKAIDYIKDLDNDPYYGGEDALQYAQELAALANSEKEPDHD